MTIFLPNLWNANVFDFLVLSWVFILTSRSLTFLSIATIISILTGYIKILVTLFLVVCNELNLS